MVNRPLQLLICAAVLAGSAGLPSALARPPRIALTKIAGDAHGVAQAVAEALDDGSLVIVPAQRVDRAIGRLGLEKLGDRDVERLAEELEVDAVIRGTFDRRTGKLRFAIFANGKKGKPFTLLVRNARSDKFRALVRDKVLARLAVAVPAEPRRSSESRKRAARKSARPTDPRADGGRAAAGQRPGETKAAGETSSDGSAEAAAAEDDDEDATPDTGVTAVSDIGAVRGPGRSANLVAARAELGLSTTARDLSFESTNADSAPPRYRNASVPGVRFEGEIYPFLLGDADGWLTGLGIAGEIDQTFGLGVPSPDTAGTQLPVIERHYSIGLRYRIAFGDMPTSPTLTVGGGYGARTFVVERGSLMSGPGSLDVPDVDYRLLDPGVAFRLPLGTRIAITLAGRGFVVTGAGPIQRTDQYGAAQLLGGTAAAGVEVLLGNRFALRIAGEATVLRLQFSGNGALANARDDDPSTIEVRGATDRYLGGAATFAVLY